MHLHNVARIPDHAHCTPYVSDAVDPTWVEDFAAVPWTQRRCILIADFVDQSPEQIRARLATPDLADLIAPTRIIALTPAMTQVRYDLGITTFPAAIPHVETLRTRWAAVADSVHWAQTLQLDDTCKQCAAFAHYRQQFSHAYGYPPPEEV